MWEDKLTIHEEKQAYDKYEFNEGERERTAKRRSEKIVSNKGLKPKYLSKKNPFKKTNNGN